MIALTDAQVSDANSSLDRKDHEILVSSVVELHKREGIRVGDFIRYADGAMRRVAHIWDDGAGNALEIQPTDGGSFHLSPSGSVSFSGGLHRSIPAESLTDSGQHAHGAVWFFHHDIWGKDRGVNAGVTFRIYDTEAAR